MSYGFSDISREPKLGEYIIVDQVTGMQIWNTDAATDFWGRIVHKDTKLEPSPLEYKDTYVLETQPEWGASVPEAGAPTPRYFQLFNNRGEVEGVFYSTDYSPGQYVPATQAQIDFYVPSIDNQAITYNTNKIAAGNLTVGIPVFIDNAHYGVTWAITNDPSGLFSIDSQLGILFLSNTQGIAAGHSYPVTVQISSNKTSVNQDTAVITISTTDTPAPIITSNNTVTMETGNTFVITCTASNPAMDTLSWSIIGGADASSFSIGSLTGNLVFNTAPVSNGTFNVTVQVEDTSDQTDSQAITVTVIRPFDPSDIGNPFFLVDFRTSAYLTLANTTQVSAILNAASNSTDGFTQGTASFRPAWPNAVGDLNFSQWTTDAMLSNRTAANWSFLSNSQGSTVFAVVRLPSVSSQQSYQILNSGGSAGNPNYRLSIEGTSSLLANSAVAVGFNTGIGHPELVSSNSSITTNTTYLITTRLNLGTGQLYLNGTSVATGSMTSGGTYSTSSWLGHLNGASDSVNFTGLMGYLVVYNFPLTDTQISNMNTYLMTQFEVS